ncbi:NAD(P)/FAD-dependent oxidoreductase [Nocardia bhagyanarayanae]|uniref:NADH dehydrogenase FAD-containing subunit n=1 Tax=Nocardia bhagyanarayanae TaxID=1215925 RepID=A0A543FE92_9NOCA|nr:FAD-dependent oxidoreductase [Nocardia bhagyanarayanae]TQM32185.1 NADH dehydrogenase FAD-containing subunit [Nocardia bhagyanarayanae]
MRIVVVGSGYAGTLVANRVAKKVEDAEVTVINPRPDFVERVRLHQQIAGTRSAATPLVDMLRDGITVRVGSVEKIGDGTVALADGERIDFDHAFLAVGSTVAPMPGAVAVGTWEGAQQARTALAALPAGSQVAVIGGGPTGIETAAEIAEARPDVRVRLIGSSVAGGLSEGASRRVRAGLERLTVDIIDDDVVEIVAGTGEFDDVVRLRSGWDLSSDLTLWAIVADVPPLAALSGLAVDARGRVIVDEFLRSVGDERIFAVGDCAAVPGARFACYTALPQAIHAADNFARLVRGRKPKPHSFPYWARGVCLGRKDAVTQLTHADDTVREAFFGGRAAVVLKEMASSSAFSSARAGRSAL